MFSKNSYLLPQVSPSLHPRGTVVRDLNGVEILLHHHNTEMFSSHFLNSSVVVEANANSLLDQNNGGPNEDHDFSAIASNATQRKQPAKKDRHSKIFTAQGPRDRRVRLSIGIARKFFDLQEMLGFDKPSKTLDWLLTKSKAAIKDLVQTKQNSGKTSSSPSECEVLSSAGNGPDPFENGLDSKRRLGTKLKAAAAKDPQQAAASNLAKESRAKARARARERTREKMSIKQMNGSGINPGPDSNQSVPGQYRTNNQLEVFQLSGEGSSSNINMSCLNNPCEADLIHESIVIKRKSKNVPSFFGYQQNVFLSRDLSSNYTIPSAHNASDNWDVSSFTSQSSLCAILDHHKFLSSDSNI